MLLAVDTSTNQLGLALYDGTQLAAEMLWTSRARHTAELAPALVEMLQHTGLQMSDVQALGVAIGPGSFTSLRVGLSFVKGLAMSRSLPLVGIPTLDIVAAQIAVDTSRPLACVLSAGRGRLALAWYHASDNGWQAAGGPLVITAEALSAEVQNPTFLAGELSASQREELAKNEHISMTSPALATRRPGVLAELAYLRWKTGRVDSASSLAPLYLHVADPIPA